MIGLASLIAAVVLTGATSRTDLRITVWPQGPEESDSRVYWLRCNPAAGTLPEPRAACRRLFAMEQPFASVPKDTVCTQIFGGPQVARVTGTFRGRRIWATFKRNDGCQIARWNRHRFLFPAQT